jgi:hypothetical protein
MMPTSFQGLREKTSFFQARRELPKRKASRGKETTALEASYRHFQEIPAHTALRKVRG